jgi:hypothetical protein
LPIAVDLTIGSPNERPGGSLEDRAERRDFSLSDEPIWSRISFYFMKGKNAAQMGKFDSKGMRL